MSIAFCALCGAKLHRTVPPGDDRERLRCGACERVYYENPEVSVGCIVCAPAGHEPSLVLARPGRGEKIQAAVLRALAEVGVGSPPREEDLVLFATLTDEGSARVYLVFRVPDGCLEAASAAAVAEPWAAALLARFAADRAARRFAVYTGHCEGGGLELRAVPADREIDA